MDPTTTLVTFMLQTPPSFQSVHLLGSWDNFTKHYPMERDIRRARGQWRGCYAFEDIICDGDRGNTSPKRTGGLKMGYTYYYYYEVDGGTEYHDVSLPSTTSCPFLPGQPVNLLSVPVEVEPPRYRSASMSSIVNGNVMTMNPADKFVTPRPPPQPPVALRRMNTAPVVPSLQKKRSARSLSPKSEKTPSSPWSRKAFFGLRSTPTPPPPPVPENYGRGRITPLISSESVEGDANIGYPVLISRSGSREIRSVPQTRAMSPQQYVEKASSSSSLEPSSLNSTSLSESISSHNSFLIPDEITEEDMEDDDNWASQFSHMSFNSPPTSLSPAPSVRRSPPAPIRTSVGKPLPQVPESDLPKSPVMPSPLHLLVQADMLPRSHFSTSTISTELTSPTDSHFGFSDGQTPSVSDFNDEYQEDLSEGRDESTYSPIDSRSVSRNFDGGFNGYSLPDGEYASEQTLRKQSAHTRDGESPSGRITFGGPAMFGSRVAPGNSNEREGLNVLEKFMSDMGYLGDHIDEN